MAFHVLDLGTTNRHKAEEIAAILAPLGLVVRCPDHLPEVDETGDTFAENALLKAQSAAKHLGRPALADDSGLAVEALNGEPGVRSARYASPDAEDADNNALLVEKVTALGLVDPRAAFVCHAVVAAPDGRVIASAEERVEGVLRWPPRGRAGFGYDPLFHHLPSNKRFAELTQEEKNAVSHRGQALRAVAAALLSVDPADSV